MLAQRMRESIGQDVEEVAPGLLCGANVQTRRREPAGH